MGFEWLDDVQGGDPSCSDALSADSRCVRAHTTDLAVGCEATSKLGASRALRLTSEGGRDSLSAHSESPTILYKEGQRLSRNFKTWKHGLVETQARRRLVPGGVTLPPRRMPEAIRVTGLGRGDPTANGA